MASPTYKKGIRFPYPILIINHNTEFDELRKEIAKIRVRWV